MAVGGGGGTSVGYGRAGGRKRGCRITPGGQAASEGKRQTQIAARGVGGTEEKSEERGRRYTRARIGTKTAARARKDVRDLPRSLPPEWHALGGFQSVIKVRIKAPPRHVSLNLR